METPGSEVFALFDDATWPQRPALLLSEPEGLIEARTADEVVDALAALEAGVARGLFAAGALAYELGYVFERRLAPLLPKTATPLLRFHLFGRQEELDWRARTRWLMDRVRGPAMTGDMNAALGPQGHRSKVERVRQLIGDGDVYQVNLTFKLGTGGGGDPFATYLALRDKARAGACAFLRFADEDVLSFSPELFFRVQGERISARPMKGTRARGVNSTDDARQRAALVGDEKERAENLMIVDLLRNDLARVAVAGSVEVTDLFTLETYPRFHTLTSGISATLAPGSRLTTIVPALFPCGSVTGAPKIRAMEIIREVEDEPRGFYCGAIGYVGPQRMAFNVGIRTVVLRDGGAEMGVGGGIVWDSDPAAEYAECLLKARFLTEADEPFRLIETMRWTPADGFHLLHRHLARLRSSCGYFGFVFDEAAIRRALDGATAEQDGARRVRLTVGVRGDTQVEAFPFELAGPGTVWTFAVSERRSDSRAWRFHHKTTLRALYDDELALYQATQGCDEVVFLNERGEVCEGSRSNIFIEREGVWLTPPLASGVLDGCLRREMIESGPQRVVERALYPDDLANGAVWFGNSLRGLIRGLPVESGAKQALPHTHSVALDA